MWSRFLPEIERLEARNPTVSGETLYGDALHGSMIMWVVVSGDDLFGMLGFRVLKRPRGPVIFVDLLVGRDFGAWAGRVQPLLLDYRDLIGAKSIEAIVRPGLARLLKKLGCREIGILMEYRNE